MSVYGHVSPPLFFFVSVTFLIVLFVAVITVRERERERESEEGNRREEGRKTASVEKSVQIACACWRRSVIAAERMLGGSYNQTFTTRENDSQRDDATTSTTIVTQRRR